MEDKERILIVDGDVSCNELIHSNLSCEGGVKSNVPLGEIDKELLDKSILIKGDIYVESYLYVDYLLIVTGDIIMRGGRDHGDDTL